MIQFRYMLISLQKVRLEDGCTYCCVLMEAIIREVQMTYRGEDKSMRMERAQFIHVNGCPWSCSIMKNMGM